MRFLILTTVICGALAFSLRAAAHGVDEPPAATVPIVADAGLAGAGTNYGLVMRDGESLLWTPEEILSAQAIYDWQAVDGGSTILAATSRGMLTTDDGGCSWSEAGETLAGHGVTDIAVPEANPEVVLAVTESGGENNGVFRSTDGGATWQATDIAAASLLMRTILVDGDRAWTDGFDRGALATRIWWSDDLGATWSRAPGPVAGWPKARLVGASGEAVYVAKPGESEAWELHRAGSELGDPEKVGELPEQPERAVEAGGRLYVLADDSTYALADGDVRDLKRPAHCLAEVPARSSPVACSAVVDGDGHFVELGASGEGEVLFPWTDVTPRECPDGTKGAERVDAIWPILRRQGIGPRPEEGEGGTGDGSGCGCRTGGSELPGGALLVLAAAGMFAAGRRYGYSHSSR